MQVTGAERGEEMGAAILDGKDLAVNIGDADTSAVDLADGDGTGRKVIEGAEVSFGHGVAPFLGGGCSVVGLRADRRGSIVVGSVGVGRRAILVSLSVRPRCGLLSMVLQQWTSSLTDEIMAPVVERIYTRSLGIPGY